LIETDRLLELIDQFAAAEGRMKWAPNKRLHFEVAVIKAIQTLSQVTLNEVIENLAALRNGKAPASTGASAVAGIADPAPRPAKNSKPAGVPDPGYSTAQEQPAADPKEAWRKTAEKVRTTRRLLAGWVDAGTALGVEGGFLVVG